MVDAPGATDGLARNGSWQTFLGTFKAGLPRQVNPAGMPLDEAFYNRFKGSPFFDEATAEAAEALLDAEKLGQGEATDLLAVGFSATDYVGHFYGNAGDEMVDQIRRLDARLGRFLAFVKARVPSVAVVLTADHGSADLIERLAEQGYPARRLEPKAWLEQLNAALRKKLPIQGDPVSFTSTPKNLYVKEVPGATREEVLRECLALLRRLPEIALAVTPAELDATGEDSGPNPEGRSLRVLLKHSTVPGRSGDILVALKPYISSADDPPYIVQHGLPYDADPARAADLLGPRPLASGPSPCAPWTWRPPGTGPRSRRSPWTDGPSTCRGNRSSRGAGPAAPPRPRQPLAGRAQLGRAGGGHRPGPRLRQSLRRPDQGSHAEAAEPFRGGPRRRHEPRAGGPGRPRGLRLHRGRPRPGPGPGAG